MRKLKTFERYTMRNKKFFWKIPTDNKLHVALLKIGAPNSFIQLMLYFKEINKSLLNEPFVYVGCKDIYDDDTWKWSSYNNEEGKNEFEKDNYIFKGEIEVEDYEIEAFKFITG